MSLNLQAVGSQSPWVEVTWTSRDALLYAIAVGAGHSDPCCELAFTTENSHGVIQQVLPTFATVLAQAADRPFVAGCAPNKRVQSSETLTLHRPLPVDGGVRIRTRLTGIYDDGWGALAQYASEAVDHISGAPMFDAESTTFLKDEGGFDGPTPPETAWRLPECPPDLECEVQIRPEQALLYRLCGDRNPLHSDPEFARGCGFKRPILHGLCTYGIAGRVLLNAICDSNVDAFRSMSARFARRVVPGETLTIVAWRDVGRWLFRVTNARHAVVIDEGTFVAIDVPHSVIGSSRRTDNA